MRPIRALAALAAAAVAAAVAPVSAAPGAVALGPPRRVTSPDSTLCPVEGEPEIVVTSAGTWVGYNDDRECPIDPRFSRVVGLQLLPRSGPPRYVPLPLLDPGSGDKLYGDPDLAPDPRGGGGVVFQTMYLHARTGGVSLELFRVTPAGQVTRLPSPTAPDRTIDKPFFAVDLEPRSRFRGRMYAVWDDYTGATRTRFRAWDGRRWLPDVELHAGAGRPDVAVGPRGEVAAAYADGGGVSVVVSRDGGRTVGEPVRVLAGGPPGRLDPSCPLRRVVGRRQRVIESPRVAYDAAGVLHVVAALGDPVGVPGGSVVRHAMSTDGGRTFREARLAGEASAEAFAPAVARLPGGGVAVAYLRTSDPAAATYDAWLAVRPRGASAFGPPVRLSPAAGAMPSAMEAYFNSYCYGLGDYIGLAPTPTGVVAVWPTTDGVARPGLDTDLIVREALVRG